MFALACLNRESLTLFQGGNCLFVFLIELYKLFPTHFKHCFSACSKFRIGTVCRDFHALILVNGSSRTNQPDSNKLQNIFLTARQIINIRRFDVERGNYCVMSRNFAVVNDNIEIRFIFATEVINISASHFDFKGGLCHIFG